MRVSESAYTCVCAYWFMYLICYAALVVVVLVALSEKTSVFIFIILDSCRQREV